MAILALYLRFSRRIYVWYLEETLWDLSGTVADNIRYGPQLKGKKLTDDEAYKLLLLADLDSSFCKKIIYLSGKLKELHLLLARTLANEPEVLLLDEPTSALDPLSTQNIEDVLLKLKKQQGLTVIMYGLSQRQTNSEDC
nr:ABC transporter I family member 17-like [Populus alba]